MSYRKALELLRAYEPKRLALGRYDNAFGCHCVIGAIVPTSRRHGSEYIEVVLNDPACRSEILAMELWDDEVVAMQRRNDSFPGSNDARYEHMVAYLEAEVAKENQP